MSALSIQPPFPIITDTDGSPLENGYVWIGTVNQPAQTSAINVYWDAALTIQATQPIRTTGGYPSRNGSPARLYVNSDYSILVQNKNGSFVYSAPAATERISGDVITTLNASQVVYDPAGTGAVATTVQAKLRETVSVRDFGAVGDGVTDDTAAIQDALSSGASKVIYPDGTYLITSSISVTTNNQLSDFGGSSIICGGSNRQTAYYITGDNVKFTNMTMDCASVVRYGVEANADNFVFDSGNISNVRSYATDPSGAFGVYIHDFSTYATVTNSRISQIQADGNGIIGDSAGSSRAIAIGPRSGVGCLGITISNNYIDNILGEEGDGISVQAEGTAQFPRLSAYCVISNNKISNCSRRAIKTQVSDIIIRDNTYSHTIGATAYPNICIDAQVGKNVQIINNIIDASFNTSGIGLSNDNNAVYDNSIISGNTIKCATGQIAGSTTYGIALFYCTGAIISGNAITDGLRYMSVASSSNCVISSNTWNLASGSTRTQGLTFSGINTSHAFYKNVMFGSVYATYAIAMSADTTNCVFDSNVINWGAQNYALVRYLDSTAIGNVFSNNVLQGISNIFQTSGTGTVVGNYAYNNINLFDKTLVNGSDPSLSLQGQNLSLRSGGWNTGNIQFGSYYVWVDATGDLRIKNGAPTSDTDGTVVGTQT